MKYVSSVLLALIAVGCAGEGRTAFAQPATPPPLPAFFENAGARLAFTLDLPPGRGPFPAVVAAHGSGRIARDQLHWLSGRFTQMGFAVLRFDKRGVGESTGTFVFVGTRDSQEVFPVLASDIAAAVRFLRSRPEIDARRIGLAGSSQAGWILPLAARELGGVSFMVLFSGPVCTVGQEMFYSDLVENNLTRPIEEANALMPSFHGAPGFDPLPLLQTASTPTLWLLGLADRSIPVELTLQNLEKLRAAGRPFEWRTYDGLDHGLGPQIWDDIAPWVSKFK